MAFKTFANGFPLPASDLNNFLMKQTVMVFADSAARTAALPEPVEGMVTYLEDTNLLEVFTGASFVPVAEEADLTTLIPKSTVTTAGDLIVADGAGSVTRLGLGAADTVLTSDGTTLSFQAGAAGGELFAAGNHTVSKPQGFYLIETKGTGPFNADTTSLSSGIQDLLAFSSLGVSFVAGGTSWTTRTSGFGVNDDIFGVAYDTRVGGLWVAGGSGGVMTSSPDGITWTSRTSGFGSTSIRGVAFGDGLFVAVGDSGTLTTSPDGITWTSRTSGFGATQINGVVYGDVLWVAVGETGVMTTSPDGITWTSRTSGFGTGIIRGVGYGDGLFVAVGDSGTLTTSPDGITWTSRTSGFGSTSIRGVGYGDVLWVAVGGSGTLTTSPDGITWTSRASNVGTKLLNSVGYGDGLFVAVGGNNALTTTGDEIIDSEAVILLTELPTPIQP